MSRKGSPEGQFLTSIVQNLAKENPVGAITLHNTIKQKQEQGMTPAQILRTLTPDDIPQTITEGMRKQNEASGQSKLLAQTLMDRLQQKSSALNQQEQGVWQNRQGTEDFFMPGIRQAISPPDMIPPEYSFNQLPAQEQNQFSVYGAGLGDVNKATQSFPSILQPPEQPKPLTPPEQKVQQWLTGLPSLTPEQQMRERYPNALPSYSTEQQQANQNRNFGLDQKKFDWQKFVDQQKLNQAGQRIDQSEKRVDAYVNKLAGSDWLKKAPVNMRKDYDRATYPIVSEWEDAKKNAIGMSIATDQDPNSIIPTLEKLDGYYQKRLDKIHADYQAAYEQSAKNFGQNPDKIFQGKNSLKPAFNQKQKSFIGRINLNQKQQDFVNRMRGQK